MIVGITLGMPEHANDGSYLATILDQDQVCGAAIMTPLRSVIISRMPEAALDPLIEDLLASERSVPGVFGPTEEAAEFARRWKHRTGERTSLTMRMRLHTLDHIQPLAYPAGTFRRAIAEERALLEEWAVAYLGDIPALPDAVDETRRSTALAVEEGRAYLWCDPEPVAMAIWTGRTWHGARVVGVYTPPALRGRGYATACVAELSRLLMANGRQFCFLTTDLANPTSNRIYARIGYRPVVDVDLYSFVRVDPP